MEEWFVLFNNIANFAGKPEGLPNRLEHIVQRAEFIKTDRKMAAQYIEHLVTKEQIENYTQPAYENGVWDAKIDVARALKAKGLDCSLIAECIGISVKEVEAL